MISTALPAIDPQEERALEFYRRMTFADTARAMEWSHGRLWRVVAKHNAFKTAEHRARRAAEEATSQRSFLAEVLDTIVTADVLDYLKQLPDDSIDCTITSIPFNCGVAYDSGSARADRMALLAYRGWMMQVFSELGRVMKPERSIVIQLGTTFDDDGHPKPLDTLFQEDLIAAGFHYTSRIFWPTHAGFYPKHRLAPRNETALLMTKRAADVRGMRSVKPTLPKVWNTYPTRVPAKYPAKRAFKGPNIGALSGSYFGATLTDNWSDIPHLTGNASEKVAAGHHPAMYSERFAARCIMLLTQPGEVVLDPFSGSGTTAAACKRLGRSFTGADLYYADEREARLRAIAPDLVSIFPGISDESRAIWEAEARRVDVTASPLTAEENLQLGLTLDVNAVQRVA